MELQPQRGQLAGSPTGGRPFQALDQALRAADLLLQSGGFRVIVLDLGSTAPELAWRIPLATWFRFRAACERSRTSLILLTQHPCARSSAELVVRLETASLEADSRVMTGMRYRAEVERNRKPTARVLPMRKPPQAERPGQWKGCAVWAQGPGGLAI
jgi:recombination protein RecA